MRKKPESGLLSEEVRSKDDPETVENPYWAEPEEHPNPELGCIRRGLCCKNGAGWFAPGEAEAAAQHLGMSPDEFARTYLVIDGMESEDAGWIEVFTPVVVDRFGEPAVPPLTRVDNLYRYLKGQCIFYDGTGCRIYPVRPIECRRYLCTNPPEQNLSRSEIARLWLRPR